MGNRKNTPETSTCVNKAMVELNDVTKSSKTQVKDCLKSAEKLEDTYQCIKDMKAENLELSNDVLKHATECMNYE